MSTHVIPEIQRHEYNEVLGRLTALVHDLDHKLPVMYAILVREKREEMIKKLVIIVSFRCLHSSIGYYNISCAVCHCSLPAHAKQHDQPAIHH